MQTLSEQIVRNVVQPRPQVAHKGTFGRVLIVAGSQSFGGAAIMNAQAAVYSGAGLVTVATDPSNKTALLARLPEAMVVDFNQDLTPLIDSANVILIGSGLGDEFFILQKVFSRTRADQVVIIDGSALTMMAHKGLSLPAGQVILTPHQMEWQRLSQVAIADQGQAENNQQALQKLASYHDLPILVLKSDRTQVYLKNDLYQLTVGGPYQATGGMGDTLAGMVAGFAAQFQPLDQAVLAAVYSHSAIAADLAKTAYVTLPTAIAQSLPAYMQKMAQAD
ncbi:NAD(P)H-hydrate dehydratase [Fructobacillus ficulneus]|uniref:ADP-dependent (S)-NAD(P)H-hydrate dehydratase n=1 Tax=Fructobacillus ficulneus TaxID=157463 RepID=A0A0K8MHY1_9LACO|nr:NAD(P)H-hydrate dehydratase [Fructobacillus ficulneus]GAP00048.1 ADP-dependent (S)-NAD(P)H-hydrate dehydratase [Fructobacillus ficulneus]